MTSTAIPAAFLKTVKAPSFSGLHSEDVEEWIMKVEKYLQLFNITEPHLQVASALTLLDTHASAWALSFSVTTETTWQQFTDAIRERFGNPNQIRQARQRLHQLRQNGPVNKYNFAFSTLKQKITNMTDEEAIYAYESGLKPQFQNHFAGNPDQRDSLNNMMRIAESLDQSQHNNFNQNNRNYNNNNNN
ncbi:hypothetical protein BGZ49_005839, partial [Haplosporangium sp. Z 27]